MVSVNLTDINNGLPADTKSSQVLFLVVVSYSVMGPATLNIREESK
jgi:hypothetical protein